LMGLKRNLEVFYLKSTIKI